MALSDTQRRFQRLDHPGAFRGGKAQAVLDHFEAVIHARMNPRVALALQQLQDFGFGEVLRDIHRKRNDETGIAGLLRPQAQVFVNRIGIVAAHGSRAAAAIKLRGTCEHKLQVVGQFRHGANRRAGCPDRIGLVDGDRRRNPVDAVDLRLVHAVQELAGVRGERLHIATLALCIKRVEDERRLAGAGHAGHHQQLVQRQVKVEVLEVVLARATDRNGTAVLHGFVRIRHIRELNAASRLGGKTPGSASEGPF